MTPLHEVSPPQDRRRSRAGPIQPRRRPMHPMSPKQRPARLTRVAAAAGMALSLALSGALTTTAVSLDVPTGLGQILQAYGPTASIHGIAEFGAVPTSAQVASLEALGLVVQPMRHVPLALVSGTVASMQAAVGGGLATDVYPDTKLELFDTASSDAMGSALPRAAGFTGKGVTVAIVDSGCDASHPDLADHVIHNVKLYSAEYASLPPDA